MGETKLSMKLLIDKNGKRVLFGEAGKECVDFLFSIISQGQGMTGSVANLYESLQTLDESYIQPNITKDALLKQVVGEYTGGFVKQATYIVMDDLVVKPKSTLSFLTLLNHLDIEIKNAFALEEKLVHLGMTEAVKLMNTSLVSNNVLTSVFFDANE